MKKLNIVRFSLTLMLSAALAATPLYPLRAIAQQESLWANNSLPTVSQIGLYEPYKWPPGVFCQEKTVAVYKNASNPQQPANMCTVEAGYGEVGDGFLKFKNTNRFLKIDTTFVGGTLHIPNTDSMYVIKSSSGKTYMHAYDNPAASLYLSTGTNGWSLVYRSPSTTDWTLKDDNNQPIMIRQYAVSKNGHYMAIEVANGIIRFDTITRQFFKFTTNAPAYGIGKDPTLHMAISNDGQYVAVSGQNYGENLDVYDLSSCAPPATQNSIDVATGCKGKRLTDFMKAELPNFKGGFQLEFNADATQLLMNAAGGRTLLQAPNTTPYYISYLGLGDSFSSGEGAYSYLPGTDGDSQPGDGIDTAKEKCHISSLAYPTIVSNIAGLVYSDFKNIACSGATTVDITSRDSKYKGQQGRLNTDDTDLLESIKRSAVYNFTPGRTAQIEFVEKYKPSAITLTIGGNDIKFAGNLNTCVISIDTCPLASDPATKRGLFETIQRQFDNLVGLYKKLHDASPSTKIYVVGYPNFVGNATTCEINALLIDPAEKMLVKEAVHYMNNVIDAAASKAGAYYVDIEDSLAGKELCSESPDKAFNGIMFGDDLYGAIGNESFHPNALGHSLMAQAITSKIGNILTHQPCPDASQVLCPDDTVNTPALPASVTSATKPIYIPTPTQFSNSSIITKEQSSISLDLSNLKPGQGIAFELHSDPVNLGSATVGPDGKLNVNLQIPSDIPAGFHTLHAYTTNLADEKVDLYQHLTILGVEGDRDEDGIADAEDPCPFVQPANNDKDFDGIDDACDGEITEPMDTTPPTVAGEPDKQPNEFGWYNSDVTINWSASDTEPSSGTSTTPPPTPVEQEGTSTYTSQESCDPAGNCSAGSIEIRLDKTAPTLGPPSWTRNPKQLAENTTLDIPVSDTLSGIHTAEYFVGDDPGTGNATPVTTENNTITLTFDGTLPIGTYNVGLRAKDLAGNWSQTVTTQLVVAEPVTQPSDNSSPQMSIMSILQNIVLNVVNTIKNKLQKSPIINLLKGVFASLLSL